MATIHSDGCDITFPDWVPVAAQNYIAHTERGLSIRALARARQCHASTVLRQVRRFESRRDDPLVDDALRQLSSGVVGAGNKREYCEMKHVSFGCSPAQGRAALDVSEREVLRLGGGVLEALAVPSAVLVAGRQLETAVVIRNAPDGTTETLEKVSRDIVQAMALREWIVSAGGDAPVMRYKITNAGRTALNGINAGKPKKSLRYRAVGYDDGQGLREAPAGYALDGDWEPVAHEAVWKDRQARIAAGETPLLGLARRRDKGGQRFLTREMVDAGERLRQDYELAERASTAEIDWEACLQGAPFGDWVSGSQARAAGERVAAGLADLGMGLGEVALRCCCYLDGLEQAERELGWAARSGKIVLRIALDRLHRHYEAQYGRFGPLIG